MNNEPDFFSMIEIDPPKQSAADLPASPVELDLTDSRNPRCLECGAIGAVNESSLCRGCSTDPGAVDLAAIATESTVNSTTQASGSLREGTMRGVGFSTREGYIQAIRNGVKAHTHASYLQTLRAQYGMTSADIQALNLPGPMIETALPVGPGITHVPTGPSVFDRPRAERQFVVGPKAEEVEQTPRIQLEHGKLVAGAAAEGHGVLVGWRGLGQLTRSALSEALESIGQVALLPAPMSARAQAGQAVSKHNNLGMVVRVARKATGATWVARWTIGAVNSANRAGESYGDVVLAIELLPNGELYFDGDEAMAASIKADYEQRIAAEVYQAGDVTSWLGGTLYDQHKAVSFGLGYYVHQTHAAAAEQLCEAVRKTGFGYGWISPALPIADSSQLRDGIVRGIREEVADLMTRLSTERQIAKTERKGGDIGEKRAGTFLRELRAIGQRVVAYGQVIGEDRVAACRDTIRASVVDLETLLGDDYSGIGQRFAGIWEEIERDQRKVGGAL